MNLRFGNTMIIFQHQNTWARSTTHRVEKGGEHRLERRGREGRLRRCGKRSGGLFDRRLDRPARREDVAPKPNRVVVTGVECDPGDRREIATRAAIERALGGA